MAEETMKGGQAGRAGSGDSPPIGDASDVQILGPLVLDVRRGEGGGTQVLLGLIDRPSPGHAQHKGRLVRRGRARRDPEPLPPAKRDHSVVLPLRMMP